MIRKKANFTVTFCNNPVISKKSKNMLSVFGKYKTEQQLISDCKAQNKKAQQHLYELYGSYMKGVCYRYVLDINTAEDLMHEGFIKVFSQIKTFEYKGEGLLKSWISRIMVNLSLDFLKEQKRLAVVSAEYMQSEYTDEDPEEDEYSLFEIVKRKGIDKNELFLMLESLPEHNRLVFNLYAIDQLKHKEIAEILGIAEVASRTRLKRARLQLKEKLAIYCNYQPKTVNV